MESHESLPYIDPDPSQAQREAANLLIQSHLPRDHSATIHPSVVDTTSAGPRAFIQQEVDRAGAGRLMSGGIDLSRYESFDDVSADGPLEDTRSALKTAYANVSYLRGRLSNITLLEEYGKNAWLIGNSQLEDILKQLEEELRTTKELSENTNRIRKTAQEDSKGELLALEETWKQGISRIVETQIAITALEVELSTAKLSSITATT
ncbi:hypothetical protein LTR64_001761 [Lithohypha guttulata]|uniref:uncharacterized protein n=1 Tax=Lithohypha guttulata TaxID=1690604 RepID=UPI002DE04231|nr:hypothetical protein LTR51_003955 [Lithohypha guttulata]